MTKFAIHLALLLISSTGFAEETKLDTSSPVDFNYLAIKNNTLLSVHGVKLVMKLPDKFKQLEQLNYKAEFNDHPFNISMASFIKSDILLAVHAEALTDNSAYLNYSYMQPTQLSGINFYTNERCAILTNEDVAEAVDLKFYKENGFNFAPSIYIKQFFKNSSDGNAEYVITIGKKVKDCTGSSITSKFKNDLQKMIEQEVEIRLPGE